MENENKKPYEIIDHTADIGIIARGSTIEEAFENAAKGMFEIIANKNNIQGEVEKNVEIESDDLIILFKKWLEELLFLFDTEKLVFTRFDVKIEKEGEIYKLEGRAWGETYNPEKHGSGPEIKAVTYHMMDVWEENGYYKAQVIFDI